MKERIKELIEKERLNYSEFANKIGIQKSVVSHLVNGRNKPSLEVIQKMLEAFEYLNPDWLILGKGNMLREVKQAELNFAAEPKKENTIKFETDENNITPEPEIDTSTSPQITKEVAETSETPKKMTKKLKQIVFFYEGDNTFKIYKADE